MVLSSFAKTIAHERHKIIVLVANVMDLSSEALSMVVVADSEHFVFFLIRKNKKLCSCVQISAWSCSSYSFLIDLM